MKKLFVLLIALAMMAFNATWSESLTHLARDAGRLNVRHACPIHELALQAAKERIHLLRVLNTAPSPPVSEVLQSVHRLYG